MVPVALLASAFLLQDPPRRPPNILHLMTDQQHAGMMSGAGNPRVKTPAMDLLAAARHSGFREYVKVNWTAEDWRLHRWAYARLTERVDAEIGRVLAALREAGLEEETVILFSSDHGDLDGAHRLEHKSEPYEESARVPFIVSWKGRTPRGRVDREHLVAAGPDLLPTICDFAGVPPPGGLPGRSVRELAGGRKPAGWRDEVVVEGSDWRMLRTRGINTSCTRERIRARCCSTWSGTRVRRGTWRQTPP